MRCGWAGGLALLLLACARQPSTAMKSPPAPSERQVRQEEDCSWDNTRAGNEAVKSGRFDVALETFMRCPKRTLPNLVGLMERYPPTRARLHDLTVELESRLSPPSVDDDVHLLVELLDDLGQYERLLRIHRRFLTAGFNDAESAVFYSALARGGYYEEALRSEPAYQRFVHQALDEYRACPSDDPLSGVGLMLSGAVGGYLLPLVGVGRVTDGACLLELFER